MTRVTEQGAKVAVVDETGKVLDTNVVYCTLPNHDKDKAKKILTDMILRNNVNLISIGNGTASKESEIFISDLLKEIDREVFYIMTNEQVRRFTVRQSLRPKNSRNMTLHSEVPFQ